MVAERPTGAGLLYTRPMAIIVFQHGETTAPGRLGLTLRDHGFKLDIRRLDLPQNHAANRLVRGPLVPADYDNVHGVVALGGNQNIGDGTPFLYAEADFIKGAHERNIPVIGICLGAQLIAHALGGKVAPLPDNAYEIGMLPVSLNPAGQTEPVLAGLAWDHPQFHHHGYHCEQLPPGAALLASSARCKAQAFRVGIRTFGFQFHPECDRHMIDGYLRNSDAELRRGNTTADEVRAQVERGYEMYARLSDRLCVNLATLLFPVTRKLAV